MTWQLLLDAKNNKAKDNHYVDDDNNNIQLQWFDVTSLNGHE